VFSPLDCEYFLHINFFCNSSAILANYDHDYECLKSDAVVNACKQVAQTAPVSLESHKWEDTAHNMPESNKLEALETSVRDTVDRDESYGMCPVQVVML